MLDTKGKTPNYKKANSQQDIQKEPFNNALWREILNSTSGEINALFDLEIETISPFGFEVLMDKRFLYGNLRRFYCYIGTKKNISVDMQTQVIQSFYEILMKQLSFKYPELFASIVLVVMKDNFLYLVDKQYTCKPTDKLIDIQLRQVETTILDDYGNYIITSLNSLITEKGEVKNYKDRAINRWRLYQLYIMQEELYNSYSPRMSEKETQNFKKIYGLAKNMINVFFNAGDANSEMSIHENFLFQELIYPRINILQKVVVGDGKNIITVRSTSYHVRDDLSLDIDKEIYQDTLFKIKNTYQLYL